MRLEQLTIPDSPLTTAVEDIRLKLASAVDIGIPAQLLNQSVLLGVDSVLQDAINERPVEELMPAIRIVYPIEGYQTDANTNSMIWQQVQLQLYFMYYFGVQSTDILPQSFTHLRDNHIRWNLEYLKDIRVKPNNTIGFDFSSSNLIWKFVPTQNVSIDHDTPFRYLDETVRIRPSTGFACSRVDISILTRNHV